MAYWHHNQLIDHTYKDLGDAAQNLGQVLAGMMDDHSQWQISRDRIQKKTGKSRSTITKAMRELEAAGVLVAYRASKRQATQYFWALCCPPECDVKSHHDSSQGVLISDAPSESPKPRTTERAKLQATQSPTLLATNTPENKPLNKPLKNKIIDPRDSGQTPRAPMKVLVSELYKLMSDPYRPDYETQRSYGDPLERLALAIALDPDGVEKTLKRKTAGAKHLAAYIEKTLLNNPHTLMEDCEELYDMTLDELEDMGRDELEDTPTRPPAPISGPKTAAGGTTTPAPVAQANRAPMVTGVSAENMTWLGDRPTDYAIRCAEKATELGLTIPEGVEAPQAGQTLAEAQKLKAAGEQLENPTGEMWQGRKPLKAHKVKVSD